MNGRITVGLSVPARGYAAALAAAAVTLERDELEPMAPDNLELHLEVLRKLPAQTPIKYHAKDRIYDGRWLGIEHSNGAEMLSFETKQRVTRKLPLPMALTIRPTGETTPSGQLRATRVTGAPLLRAMIGESRALTFTTTARPDCVVVGTLALLEEDLTAGPFFALRAPGDVSEGTLQDIVRAREVSGAKRYYRAAIVPTATGPNSEMREWQPPVVVFDGGRSYLRWRHVWPGARQLVIIDRSLPSAEETAYELSMAFAERSADSDLLQKLRVPEGIEAVSFERST